MTMEQRSMESRGQVRHCSPRRGTQRGVTLFGLMFWAILIGIVSLLSLKVLPTLNEYFTIKRTVEKIATSGATTVPEIRTAFEKQKDIEVQKVGDKVVVSYAYDREIHLFGPAFLTMKYKGQSR